MAHRVATNTRRPHAPERHEMVPDPDRLAAIDAAFNIDITAREKAVLVAIAARPACDRWALAALTGIDPGEALGQALVTLASQRLVYLLPRPDGLRGQVEPERWITAFHAKTMEATA